MCGIIGYVGEKEAYPLLIKGLERVEYRGYDSVGICTTDGRLHVLKDVGRVDQFKNHFLPGKQGIAHSRWATHGGVCQRNAHPFIAGEFLTLVHNGIIENYLELKEELRKSGVEFSSETDSEVILHLISAHYHGNLLQAVQKTLPQLRGAYAFAVMTKETKEIIAARNGCPLLVGIGNKENFVASDVAAFIEHTKKVIYVNDFEIVRITPEMTAIFDKEGNEKEKDVKEIQWDIEQAQKQGCPHFMLKEIKEQPAVVAETLKVPLPKMKPSPQRIIVIGCGTAGYAGLLGKYILETVAKIPVLSEIASEFRYKQPLFYPHDLVIAISQSGETADTLAAVRLAKEHGVKTWGIVNVRESTIAREVDEVVYTRAGPEIGVASTKAFMTQVLLLYQLAFNLAGKEFVGTALPSLIEKTLGLEQQVKAIALKYAEYQHFLYIGRNTYFPLALEGALKLKEISYIHAEAYPAGELKHGPIA
ncbi:glutamine--fructose-6-phosphate transaminase (isomerizing), partial [Candidatus Woesearchaeota archaeon]|nr:glutamine--fructose-6-phosphate transaminase (isomerizing) [Candidatus Woesearchaeota archaeon]